MQTQIILDELQGYPEPAVLERDVATNLRDTGLVPLSRRITVLGQFCRPARLAQSRSMTFWSG